jgi:hypothetical protein
LNLKNFKKLESEMEEYKSLAIDLEFKNEKLEKEVNQLRINSNNKSEAPAEVDK